MVSEMKNFLASRDIKHETTAVYNPEQNGMVESFNQYLKQGVQTFNTGKIYFENGINELLFSYRATSPMPESKSPGGELMFHRRMRTTYQPEMRPRTTPASTSTTTNNHAPHAQTVDSHHQSTCIERAHLKKGGDDMSGALMTNPLSQ